MNTKGRVVFAFFLAVVGTANGVLTGYERNILEQEVFGCQWRGGGIDTTLECNCRWQGEELYIQENTIRTIDLNTIRISNCDAVRFGGNSVQTIRNLRRIQLGNIRNLILEERSFYWAGYVPNGGLNTPSLRVSIESCNVHQISSYTFNGRINEISFDNVVVENLAPFSFSSLRQNQKITFANSDFKNTHPQAFKKFSTEYLTIMNCTFGYLPSRSFSELVVTENFLIQNSTFDTIKPAAFLVHNPKRFEITNSEISTLEGEGFKVTTRGDVLLRDNIFNATSDGAFMGISVNLEEVPTRKLITLDGLTFNTFAWAILQTNRTSFEPKVFNILTRETCDCKYFERSVDDAFPLKEFRCSLDADEPVTFEDFKSYNCSILTGNTTIVVIVCVSLILLIIIVAALVFYFKKAYASDKYGEEKKNKDGKLSMIVPDGRTYRETELHVIVERADLLTTDL